MTFTVSTFDTFWILCYHVHFTAKRKFILSFVIYLRPCNRKTLSAKFCKSWRPRKKGRGHLTARSKASWRPGARPSDGQEQGQLTARSKASCRPGARPSDGQEEGQLTAGIKASWRPGARPADGQEHGQLTAGINAICKTSGRPANAGSSEGPEARPFRIIRKLGQLTASRKVSWRPRCLERSICWPWATCLQTPRRPVRQDPKLFS